MWYVIYLTLLVPPLSQVDKRPLIVEAGSVIAKFDTDAGCEKHGMKLVKGLQDKHPLYKVHFVCRPQAPEEPPKPLV